MKRTILRTILDLLYPRRCPVCDGAVAPFGSLVCEGCEEHFRYIKAPFCLKCGKKIATQEEEYCADCQGKRHLFRCGRAVFEYKSIADSLYRFKYKGRQEYGAYYAACMAQSLSEFFKQHQVQALVPVPVHVTKKHSRGYNQAEVLAKELGKYLEIPVRCDLIKRVRKTAPMKDLSAEARQNNLKKAFKICCNDVKLDTIVIIDDIYTTGSTIDAMCTELQKVGIKNIYYVALAIGRGI